MTDYVALAQAYLDRTAELGERNSQMLPEEEEKYLSGTRTEPHIDGLIYPDGTILLHRVVLLPGTSDDAKVILKHGSHSPEAEAVYRKLPTEPLKSHQQTYIIGNGRDAPLTVRAPTRQMAVGRAMVEGFAARGDIVDVMRIGANGKEVTDDCGTYSIVDDRTAKEL